MNIQCRSMKLRSWKLGRRSHDGVLRLGLPVGNSFSWSVTALPTILPIYFPSIVAQGDKQMLVICSDFGRCESTANGKIRHKCMLDRGGWGSYGAFNDRIWLSE